MLLQQSTQETRVVLNNALCFLENVSEQQPTTVVIPPKHYFHGVNVAEFAFRDHFVV